ncbi:MAG: hypothetical protein VZQ83_05180 [Eubacterium sp.]|nr:hypothetical protein [Eubacterium sp.]
MVIQSSDVAMSSGRSYQRKSRDRSSVRGWGEVLSATTSPTATESRTVTQKEAQVNVVEMYQNYSSGGKLVAQAQEKSKVEKKSTLKVEEYESFEIQGRPLTVRELFSLLLHRRQEAFERFMEHFRIGMSGGVSSQSQTVTVSWEGVTKSESIPDKGLLSIQASESTQSSAQSETEVTTFDSGGRVKTADGRQIDFDVSLFMGRHWEETAATTRRKLDMNLVDPLVINFGPGTAGAGSTANAPMRGQDMLAGGFTAELSGRTFSFDLDADGELDNIAMLGEMCGFLALDKNEDGEINDGSELFGAGSGDGFADLAVYDLDGNGWIDEADPVFDQLKIWSKTADGKDVLVGLGVRGIGAIFLGHTPTEFSLKNAANETQGVIRSTGVFLREDGSAGTIQQVDLAKKKGTEFARKPDTAISA